ncbi:MAG: response regulator [Acidobacteriota bacterium]
MAPSADGLNATFRLQQGPSALLVDPTLVDAMIVVRVLETQGFHVTLAETFNQARQRMSVRPPDVFVTEIRLGEYNGLQLVLRAKSLRPEVAALVVTSTMDPVLQTDAEAMGATFVVKPVSEGELLAAIFRTLFESKASIPHPIRAPFERRVAQRRGIVIPMPQDRRRGERRRDSRSLLRLVSRGN